MSGQQFSIKVAYASNAAQTGSGTSPKNLKMPKTLELCHHCGNWNESKNPKKIPDPRVRIVMDTLEGIRGYPSMIYPAEAAGVKKMLQHYEPEDILNCYQHLKTQHFFKDKNLSIQTVATQIGEWKKVSTPITPSFEDVEEHRALQFSLKPQLLSERQAAWFEDWKTKHPDWTPENRGN